MSNQPKDLKKELLDRLHAHTGIVQDEVEKNLKKLKTPKQLYEHCQKSADKWEQQGENWDHYFYFQFAYIYKSIADKAQDLSRLNNK